jgi:hypothetical protein
MPKRSKGHAGQLFVHWATRLVSQVVGSRAAITDEPATRGAVAMSTLQPTLIAINPVIADRADDFEDWLRTIVVPAVREHRPEQQGRWEVLRATDAEDGTVIFTFIFHGGDASEWHLEPLLTQALGSEGAQRAMANMSAMMKGQQYGWILAPIHL